MQLQSVQYDHPLSSDPAHCGIAHAWARVHPAPSPAQSLRTAQRIRALLRQRDAVLVAHYYVDGPLQDLARETGGCVGDSLEMARFGAAHSARTLVVAGVRFMGETAKILSPDKQVLMPDGDASCSLDLGCPAEDFGRLCDAHPERTVVVYANTSAAVKARAHWVVTSSVGQDIVAHLHARGEKILWAPDRHLRSHIQRQTGADMLLWQGSCLVHDEFKAEELAALARELPGAAILAHPEAPAAVVAQADAVGSTTALIEAAGRLDAGTFIVATDQGLLHEMRRRHPRKRFVAAPTAGHGASCKSCAMCPWMAMNSLEAVARALEQDTQAIAVDPATAQAARIPIERMLAFAAAGHRRVRSSGQFEQDAALFQHFGPA